MNLRDRLSFATLAVTVVTAAACGSSAPRPAPVAHTSAPARTSPTAPTAPPTDGSTGARLTAELDAWDKTVVVNPATPGHGLGAFELTVEGTPVWPPQGPGCAALVTCCEGFTGDGDAPKAMQLACQMSVAKGPACASALDTITAIAHEDGAALPASCSAGG